ncbi:hypothetical protein ACJJTC_007964 [Scirpophaga incertulas]
MGSGQFREAGLAALRGRIGACMSVSIGVASPCRNKPHAYRVQWEARGRSAGGRRGAQAKIRRKHGGHEAPAMSARAHILKSRKLSGVCYDTASPESWAPFIQLLIKLYFKPMVSQMCNYFEVNK